MQKLIERKEMGDKRPSEFLSHLRSLGAVKDESTLSSIWFMRLPQYLKVGLANQQTLTLKNLIEISDNIHAAVGKSGINLREIKAPPQPEPAPTLISGMAEMMKCIQQMSVAIAGIAKEQQRKSRDRSKSENPASNRDKFGFDSRAVQSHFVQVQSQC